MCIEGWMDGRIKWMDRWTQLKISRTSHLIYVSAAALRPLAEAIINRPYPWRRLAFACD